jgi:hypothetical protein
MVIYSLMIILIHILLMYKAENLESLLVLGFSFFFYLPFIGRVMEWW